MKRILWIVVLPLVLLGTVLGLYLFRERHEDVADIGIVTIKYRWGYPHELRVDANRDGTDDGLYLLPDDAKVVSPHSPFTEGWESSQCDGFLDLHFRFDPAGDLSRLESDTNRDGTYDTVRQGAEAQDFLRTMPRPAGCGRK